MRRRSTTTLTFLFPKTFNESYLLILYLKILRSTFFYENIRVFSPKLSLCNIRTCTTCRLKISPRSWTCYYNSFILCEAIQFRQLKHLHHYKLLNFQINVDNLFNVSEKYSYIKYGSIDDAQVFLSIFSSFLIWFV